MSALPQIPACIAPPPGADHGNALPVLHEVRHALERLVASGASTLIDLRSMPFGPGDEARLTTLLGTGEVHAVVDSLGPTIVQETAIPGVWLVDYQNAEGHRLALHLEVTCVPSLLRTQCGDLDTALGALDARLGGTGADPVTPGPS
jgi:hydrogenase-1 operon protein HyaF